jgi:hypothetical protein
MIPHVQMVRIKENRGQNAYLLNLVTRIVYGTVSAMEKLLSARHITAYQHAQWFEWLKWNKIKVNKSLRD